MWIIHDFSILSRVQGKWCGMCRRLLSAWILVAWAAASPHPVSCRMQSGPLRSSAGQVSMLGGLGQIAAAAAAEPAAVRPPPMSGGDRATLPQVDNAVWIKTDSKCLPLLHTLLFLFDSFPCMCVKVGVRKVVLCVINFHDFNKPYFSLFIFSYTILKMFVLMYLCSTVLMVGEKILLTF